MKNRYWLLPVLMLVSTWPYAFVCEQLPRGSKPLVTLFWFVVIALLLNRTCTRRTVLISSMCLLMFCFVLAVLDLLVPLWPGLRELGMMLAYLWEFLFGCFLSLPFPRVPVLYYLFPALLPFAWAPFCKHSS